MIWFIWFTFHVNGQWAYSTIVADGWRDPKKYINDIDYIYINKSCIFSMYDLH